MAKVTGLSGNEIYCLALKKYSPGELVVGNSVQSMGFLGSLGAGLNNMLGGEVPQVTQASIPFEPYLIDNIYLLTMRSAPDTMPEKLQEERPDRSA